MCSSDLGSDTIAIRHIVGDDTSPVVLAEVGGRVHDPEPPASVPYFRNDDETSLFLRLRGHLPTD